MPTCAFLSFRLGLTDGVSIAAASWMAALRSLGFDVVTVAGEGPVDRLVRGLAIGDDRPPSHGSVDDALADADLVVVENLLTIPMNPAASTVVAQVLRGRPAILHHHDPAWQRERYAHLDTAPSDDPRWRHVTVNEFTRRQYAERGIDAVCIYNGFDTDIAPGDRERTRRSLGVEPDERLAVHPVRAIERKNVPAAIELAERLDATYWLTGPPEEGFSRDLERLLTAARCRVLRRPVTDSADLYAAADVVLFPSSWEGFGNPPIEASLHRRPVVVGDHPVTAELRGLGFDWFDPADPERLISWLAHPDPDLLDRNHELVARHLSLEVMTRKVQALLDEAGWLP